MLLPSIAPVHHTTLIEPILAGVVSSPLTAGLFYACASNVAYLARRAHLRKKQKRDIFSIRTARDPRMSLLVYSVCIAAWQTFVIFFPITELVARSFGYVTFMFAYPKAKGFGFILEPLSVQHLPLAKRAKQQIRLDWHEFSVNQGDIGREGYRHPPAVKCNKPHLDIPQLGIKHWPWRRRYVQEAREKFKHKAKC